MLDWYRQRNWQPVREALRKIKDIQRADYNDAVVKALNFFNRVGDVDSVKEAMKVRYGIGIKSAAGKSRRVDGEAEVEGIATEYYTRDAATSAFDLNLIEHVNTGVGTRVVQTLVMTTNPDQLFQYVDAEAGEDADSLEDVEELINEVREIGQFETTFTELDMASVMVESSALHIYYDGEQLAYDVVTPNNLTIKYGNKIKINKGDGSDPTEKWVDYRKLEDASAIIICTANDKGDYDSTPDKQQYLAYVGACEDHPNGRYVVYRAQKPWPLPEPNAYDADIDYEHMEGSERCNPLTWMRNTGSDTERQLVTTEYPIVLWRGGHRFVSTDRIPITTSLYENCMEIEIGWSRILRATLRGARGSELIKLGSTMSRLPRSNDVIQLTKKDDYSQVGWPAVHAKDASMVLCLLTEQVVGGYNVPGYAVLGNLAGINPASGIALAIQTQPHINFMNRRFRLNKDAAARIFDIERALLVQHYPKEAGGLLKPSIKQRWQPGEWTIPQTEIDEATAVTAKLDNKTIDIVQAVRREHGLATDAQAEALIEKMEERDPEYKGQTQKPTSFSFGQKPNQNQNNFGGREDEDQDNE